MDSAADRRVYAITGWRRILLWPLGLLARGWAASIRIDVSPHDQKRLRETSGPTAFVIWHNRLFLVAEVARRYRGGKPIYGLVSASRDGAWLAAFFSLVGIESIRGSSSRLGREAVALLIEALRRGQDVGVTPDGPRGPCYDFKNGAIVVARRSRADVFLAGFEFESAWRLKSWDRFVLPKPFSRVRFRAEIVPANAIQADPHHLARWRDRMLAINPDENTQESTIV